MMGLMWKNCFYKNIEQFRKSLKVLKAQFDINSLNDKLANHAARLAQEFLAFLNDSSGFISDLMKNVSKIVFNMIFFVKNQSLSARKETRGDSDSCEE